MNIDKYVKDVLKRLQVDKKTKKRIEEDLTDRIEMAMEDDPYFNVISDLGTPEAVAKEFMENLELNDEVWVNLGVNVSMEPFEYKSQATIFGLPLVHVNTGGRYQTKHAKGLIAIGDVATGVISVGGIAFGVVGIGGIGMGIIGIGGVSLGVLALGGVAIGGIALGAVSIGIINAIGALPWLLK